MLNKVNRIFNIKKSNISLYISAFVGIFFNLILFLFKIIVGNLTNTMTLIADSFNNLSDSLNSILVFVGGYISSKPADKNHPYGHGRFEYIISLAISLIIFFISYELLKDSLTRIFNNEVLHYNNLTFIVLLLSFVLKLGLFILNRIFYKKYNLLIFKATYKDAFSDILITISIFVSILFNLFYNFNIDAFLSVIISLIIGFSAITLFLETVEILLGKSVDCQKIKDYILSFDRILEIHDLYIHQYGNDVMYGMCDVVVSQKESLIEIHELIDEIEFNILKKYNIRFSMHIDPQKPLDDRILEVINKIDSNLKVHDCRLLENEKYLSFDIMTGWEDKYIDKKKDKIIKELNKIFDNYKIEITIDREN